MRYLAAIILVCIPFWLGCPAPVERKPPPPKPTIQGIVVNVTVACPNGYDAVTLIEFEDGRVQKLRTVNSRPLLIQKGKLNVIEYDSYGQITSVKIDE